jgi:hypothetical protein
LDIKNLSRVNEATARYKNNKGALAELQAGSPLAIQIGDYKMPVIRERVAPGLEAVLRSMVDEELAVLRGFGVEIDG